MLHVLRAAVEPPAGEPLLDDLLRWLEDNQWVLATLGFGSIATFVGTLLVIPVLVAKIRPDYFVDPDPPPEAFFHRHPFVRWTGKGFKNLVGTVFVLMGLLMLVLPGQGILTTLIGLSLVDFPGKRKFELWLVSRRPVRRSIAWIRTKAHRPPLLLPHNGTVITNPERRD